MKEKIPYRMFRPLTPATKLLTVTPPEHLRGAVVLVLKPSQTGTVRVVALLVQHLRSLAGRETGRTLLQQPHSHAGGHRSWSLLQGGAHLGDKARSAGKQHGREGVYIKKEGVMN